MTLIRFGGVSVSRKSAKVNSQGRKPLETIRESRKPQRGDRDLPHESGLANMTHPVAK